jgi:uroporphyrinogen decarboxylase
MTALTHRERVIKALNHEEADRVPRDLGGAGPANINITAYTNLVEHLGFQEQTGEVRSGRPNLTAVISEAVLHRFDIDTRPLRLSPPEVRPEVLLDEHSYRDEWGVVWVRPEGGHYINTTGPFQEKEPALSDLDRYAWPDPKDPGRIKGLKERAIRLREETDFAIVLSLPFSIVRECQRVRGFAEWMEDLLINPALAEAVMEHTLMVAAGTAEFLLEEVGEYVDVVLLPDDMGFQDRPYVRPELYRQKIKPYHRRLVDAIKSKTKAKVLMHSDGSVYGIIPDLIDIGVEALNPVQVSANDMGSERLKAEFGDSLCFWGAIDTHWALPSGTPEDVRNEVKTRMQHLAPGGGYVMASVHNIQADVPPENIVAMFDSALEYGRY